jgi:hypothetical protein
MKNTWRIAIIISLFTAGKMVYSYTTRVTQKEVIAYVEAIDKHMKMVDRAVSLAILDASFSSSEEDGDRDIQTVLTRIKSAKDSIEKINVPRDDDDFNNLKGSSLAQLKSDSAGVSDILTNIVHKISPQKEAYEIDRMNMYFTGNITMKKSPLNDSLNAVISGLTTDFDNRRREGMRKYDDAKQLLYTKYKIIHLTTFQ